MQIIPTLTTMIFLTTKKVVAATSFIMIVSKYASNLITHVCSAVFYEEYVNVLKQSYTNIRFYNNAINEIDQLR